MYFSNIYLKSYNKRMKMSVSYKKLFKILIDRNLRKKDLKKMASIGNSTMTKLANDENVTMEVTTKI